MTESQLLALDPALIGYLEGFRPSCCSSPTFDHMGMYVRGLLSDLERKSAEPIGLASGTPPRTVQEFLRDHAWDYEVIRRVIQTEVAQKVQSMPNDGLGGRRFGGRDERAEAGDQEPWRQSSVSRLPG